VCRTIDKNLSVFKSSIGSGRTNESNGIYKKEVCVARKHMKKWGYEDKRFWRSLEADVIISTLIRSCLPEADVIISTLIRSCLPEVCWNKICLTLPLKVLMITRYYKLSIGYANICSSVQDHRQIFEIINRFWKNKREQRNKEKGSLKASEENCSWSDNVIRSKFIRSEFIRSWKSLKAKVHQKMQT